MFVSFLIVLYNNFRMNPPSLEQYFAKHIARMSNAARISAVVLICFFLVGIWFTASRFFDFGGTRNFPTPDEGKWQAVFLTNGQVYFGHLVVVSREYITLNDVFYIQQGTQPQTGSVLPTSQPNINLVKLGGELHGPEDKMYVPKDRILFWENLRTDSQVVQTIEKTSQ